MPSLTISDGIARSASIYSKRATTLLKAIEVVQPSIFVHPCSSNISNVVAKRVWSYRT
jgi:hypothetical protein